jgi:hypothetical protein
MPKVCAYCGAPPPLTREHVWPAGFLKRGSFELKFSARANKTFEGDLTIADVCGACNNGPLSALDDHACELYDRRFGKKVEPNAIVTFTYDHGLLLRWLLKVSYNSARSTGSDVDLLGLYRHVIKSPFPCSPAFAVAFVATIGPSLYLNETSGETRRIYPLAARSGPMQLPGVDIADLAALRCVMINSFLFTLVICRPGKFDPARFASAFKRVAGQPLQPSGRMRVGPPSLPAHVALGGIEAWPRSGSSVAM